MAQIGGSIFGLTLAAYIFFADIFRESVGENDTYYDVTITLLKRYFHILILLAKNTTGFLNNCIR